MSRDFRFFPEKTWPPCPAGRDQFRERTEDAISNPYSLSFSMSATACDTLGTQVLSLRAGMLCAAKPHCFPSAHSHCTLYTLGVSASSKLWVFSIVLNFSQVGLHSYICLHSYNFPCLMDGVSHLNMFQAYQYLSLYMPIGHGLVVLSRESTHIHGPLWLPMNTSGKIVMKGYYE